MDIKVFFAYQGIVFLVLLTLSYLMMSKCSINGYMKFLVLKLGYNKLNMISLYNCLKCLILHTKDIVPNKTFKNGI